jgi:endonuclease YncB( thermonuclease family)
MRLTLNQILTALVIFLFCSSLFFTIRVISFKRGLAPGTGTTNIKTGQAVTVTNIIDGDEVIVRAGEDQVTVRLLGVYSYDPTVSDPLVQPVARMSFLFLEQALRNGKVEVVFDELKFDSRKRLLAYLHKDGVDIGMVMIGKGLSLTYTKYPFSRMNSYLLAEEEARRNKKGLWADGKLALRSRQLQELWDAERTRGD